MGVYHRDYMRPGFQGEPQQRGPRAWSVVTWLIVINVAVYVLQWVLAPGYFLIETPGGSIPRGYTSWEELKAWKIWTLLTYMFAHGNLLHLAVNMFVLYFAGRNVLAMLGQRHFLVIYFGGGLLGAFAQISFGLLIGRESFLIGASAGVVAAVIAMAALIPEQKVYLLLFFVIPIRMKMKTLAIVFIAIDVAMLVAELVGPWSFGIGNLAHLGGALFGWLYIIRGLSGSDRRRPFSDQSDRWLSRFGGNQVVDAEVADSSGKKRSWFQSSKTRPYVSDNVDRILEKISEQGMQSLTDEERKILEKSSEKLAKMTNRIDRDR